MAPVTGPTSLVLGPDAVVAAQTPARTAPVKIRQLLIVPALDLSGARPDMVDIAAKEGAGRQIPTSYPSTVPLTVKDGRAGHLALARPIELRSASLLITHRLRAPKSARFRPKVMPGLLALLPAVKPPLEATDMERRTTTVVVAEGPTVARIPGSTVVALALGPGAVGRVMVGGTHWVRWCLWRRCTGGGSFTSLRWSHDSPTPAR